MNSDIEEVSDPEKTPEYLNSEDQTLELPGNARHAIDDSDDEYRDITGLISPGDDIQT